jgi:hypothetical protein
VRAALALVTAAVLAVVPAGCAGPPERGAAFDPFGDVRSAVPTEDRSQRAAPRWEEVASLTGNGSQALTFDVDQGALQWRVTWTCDSGPVTVAERGGEELGAGDCPADGQGYGITTGPVAVSIDNPGTWEAVVEQQVDTPLSEPPLQAMRRQGARVVARGEFLRVERRGEGEALLYRLPNGRHALRFEGFATLASTDLFVWLSESENPETSADAYTAPYVELAELRSTAGEQNYLLPRDVDVDAIRSIVLWCEPVRIAYAAAVLSAP